MFAIRALKVSFGESGAGWLVYAVHRLVDLGDFSPGPSRKKFNKEV
jgi:hypothetical protein